MINHVSIITIKLVDLNVKFTNNIYFLFPFVIFIGFQLEKHVKSYANQ